MKSTEVVSKQWPIYIDYCHNILNKEALLWKQRWIISLNKLSCTFIDATNYCNELLFTKIYEYLKTL
jgi:hypothetical protein